jgi:hypothetical protein
MMFGNPVPAKTQSFGVGCKVGGIGQRATH